MSSDTKSPPECSSSNSKKKTTVRYSKINTTFSTTENGYYIIKEEKYEISKFPFTMETASFDTERPTGKTEQKNATSPSNVTSVEISYDETSQHGENEAEPAEGTIQDNVVTEIKDEEQEEATNCNKNLGTQKDPTNQCKLDKEENFDEMCDIQNINFGLDAVYEYRLSDIEAKASDDIELKIATYQEWLETLLKRNQAVLNSLRRLKEELGGSMEVAAVEDDTRLKIYRDRDALVKFIQEAFHNGVWNIDSLKLENVPVAEFLKSDFEKSTDGDNSSIKTQSSTGRRRR